MNAQHEEILIQGFKDAARAAEEAARSSLEDGGACNFDTPAFRVDRVSNGKFRALVAPSGLTVSEFTWRGGKKWLWLNLPSYGQGNRRTRASQAAVNVLERLVTQVPGLRVFHYMQMD